MQCCGSGMFIPDPDFIHTASRIQQQQQKRRGKNLFVQHFFVATNITNKNYLIFEMVKKKIWVNLKTILELFTQKIVN
jgi:hypothetical protein